MTTGGSSIYWDDGTYKQRIINTDDSTANTAVFNFQQSENNGSSWKNLLEIRDNGRIVLTNKTGGIYRVDDGATNEPLIHLSNNNVDSSIMRIDGNGRTSVVNTQSYGFDLKYIGTGEGENNSLDLIADNMDGANVTAISVSNNGKIGIGDKFNTNYRLYVNGNSYLKGNNFLYGDLSAFYDGVDQYLQYTAEGTVASHAAKISLYRIIASGKAGTAGTKVPGVQLDAATGMLHLQAAASDPSATAGARIKFTYWNSASDNSQPVYISHIVNDSYRAPYGLKIWGSEGTAPGAWLEVEGNLYIGSASNSNSNDNAALYIRGMSAIEGYDTWLRLNDNSSFSSGTLSPKLIRSDEALQVGSGGANFYANSSGNGYIQNTFGVHGTDTTKHFFVNGTSRFADDITMDSGSEILFNPNTQYLRWRTDTSNNNSTGRNWYGIGTYQNTSDSNNSWLNISNYFGINITTKGNTYLRHNNYIIPHTNNQTGTVGSASQPVYINGGVVTAITGTLANSISGNANRAQLLRNYYVDTADNANSTNRPASANLATTGSGGLVTFKATASMTTAKPPSDAHILHMFWDNTGGYDAQIAVQTGNSTIYSRGCSAGTWNPWKTILDSDNYTSYTVTKTGSGASGTWGINISGNAATVTKLATARSITIGAASKTFDGTANISYTPYEMGLVRALYDTDSNLNAFANHGHALGMCNLADNGLVDNPGGKTGWHHVINLTWRDTSDNNGSTTNEWCTQIANACGSSDLYVRSRSGGSITNGTAWVAPWTKILTDANYGSIADNRYVKKSGDTMTGALNLANSTWNKAGDDAYFGDNDTAGSFAIKGINGNTNLKMVTKEATSYGTITWDGSSFRFSHNIFAQEHIYAGGNNKVHLWEDSEGGNIQIIAPNGKEVQMDMYNSQDFRIYSWNDAGTYVGISMRRSDGHFFANAVHNAIWNDYAECREADTEKPGRVLFEKGDDTLGLTNQRLQAFAGVSSDTYGVIQGETEKAKTPIAVAGRVLVYTYQDRNNYKPGDCVCAAPGGTVDIMTRDEIAMYPDRIVGTVSCVPDYEEWGTGKVKVNGRIWIKVR